MPARLPDLPVLEALPALTRAFAHGRGAVLAAPPGSGKTTLVPLALLDEPWLANRKIVMLEPRRLAARASAARMAWLLGEKVGQTAGYRIRFERKVSAATRIEVVTEGLLARQLQRDPELPGVGLVIFDEFHERSLDVDLALALTLDARANLNPDLRVLVMSATLDTQQVARLLGTTTTGGSTAAPIIEAGGRMYPVDIRYRAPEAGAPPERSMALSIMEALEQTQGDVLAFLPGAREIRATQRELERRTHAGVTLHPLYGYLPAADQDAALQPARDGHRKVILATNIAQTSLTVEGVTAVVDSGFVRVARFDAGAGANRLDTIRVSRASAEQRAGRAGRLGPGVCYRLWSEEQHARLPAHDTPEILAADLSRFALELAAWGVGDPSVLALMDQPPPAMWEYARGLLTGLGALGSSGRVTSHGREMARLPTSPRLAHMLLLARDQEPGEDAAWIAALLEERIGGEQTDLETHLENARAGRMDPPVQRRLRETVAQFRGLLDLSSDSVRSTRSNPSIGQLVSRAYPERIARRRGDDRNRYLCEDGGEARLRDGDPLSKHEWLAIAHWEPGPQRRIRLAAPLTLRQIESDHAGRIRSGPVVQWDPKAGAVVAEEQRRLGAIVLSRRDRRAESGEAVQRAMLEGVRAMGLSSLPWSDASRQWQARVLSLRAWRPDEGWPDVSDARLAADLESWLAPWLDGVTRRAHLAGLDMMQVLGAMLPHAAQQQLARLAPTHVVVPTGSRIALEYSADGTPPALSVRLQELFGLTDTPRVNDGRTPVTVHLLSPARRPLAVTQDLAGFWARTYPEVRKEMKGRYPRHPWPDDPVAAVPTRRAKPRGT